MEKNIKGASNLGSYDFFTPTRPKGGKQMNTTSENQQRIETGSIEYARQLSRSKKPMYDAETSPLYSQCVFHSDLCNTRCLALIEPVCFKCDECRFFKSKEDWHRDPYSGYVEKRKKNA